MRSYDGGAIRAHPALLARKLISKFSLHAGDGCSSPIVGPVAQLVEAHGLGPCQSRFESGRGHLESPRQDLDRKAKCHLGCGPQKPIEESR